MLNKLSLILFTLLLTTSFASAGWGDFFDNDGDRYERRDRRGGRQIRFTGRSSRRPRRAKARAMDACRNYRPTLRNCHIVNTRQSRYGGWEAIAMGTLRRRGGGGGGNGGGGRVTFYGTSSKRCSRAEARAITSCQNYRPRLRGCRIVDTERYYGGCRATAVGHRR